MTNKQYLLDCAKTYREDLINNIMPFWLKNGLDTVNGGVYTCVDRDGSIIDTTKSVWFQGRFGFIAAFAYNNIENNPNGSLLPRAALTSLKNIVSILTDECSLK